MSNTRIIDSFTNYLTEKNISWESDKIIENDIRINVYGKKPGHQLGVFFPYDLFVFIVENNSSDLNELKQINNNIQNYVDQLYKLPKMLRIRIPFIFTLIYSNEQFSKVFTEYGKKDFNPEVGSENNCLYLIDLKYYNIISNFEKNILKSLSERLEVIMESGSLIPADFIELLFKIAY